MHKTSRNRPGLSATHAGTRRTNSEHKTKESPRPLPTQTPERGRPTPCTKRAESPRPLPPQTPERGGPTPCTKQADIAPSPSATHAGTRRTNSMHKTSHRPSRSATNAGTRRTNSMHKTSRNRPGPFRHKRRNAAEQLHAQNEPESPRPLPPHTPQRGGPTPCTKRAGIAPAPSATHAGTRRTNSMHKTSRNRPGPFRHTRHNAADQLHAQNEPESPRPVPPQTPERGGPTPCTKRAGIAPAPSATTAGTRRTNSMHKTSRIARPVPPQTPGGSTPCTKQAGIAPALPPQTPERGRPTPCTKRADIAPARSATNAGTRRTNSMHKTSRNRPGPFRHNLTPT